MIAVYKESYVQSHAIGVHLIFGPVNGTMQVKGLNIKY